LSSWRCRSVLVRDIADGCRCVDVAVCWSVTLLTVVVVSMLQCAGL